MKESTHMIITFLICVAILAQSSFVEAETAAKGESEKALLAGDGQRTWVKDRIDIILSYADRVPKCTSGEVWTFAHGEKGVRKTCGSGKLREEAFRWEWAEIQNDWLVLKVDEKRYVVEFRQQKAEVEGDPPVLITILREERESQAEPIDEIRLKYQDL